ncbi:MAG TPA: dephospho-CoA kinase [Acidimicrobiales bacterium]|nr:dephospho-CoA kinase [Acidimicrobiales bacterium]
MFLVGLTGGIGAGKSTVAGDLAARGAAVIDADGIAREVVEPGGRAYDALVERFGAGILQADGRLDRQKLADVVFNQPDALAALNEITHPAIGSVMAERVVEAAESNEIVVVDIPLLNIATKSRLNLNAVVVVDAPEQTAVERLVQHRGFSESDARARIAAQISRDERRALADFVIDNSGDHTDLSAQLDALWTWLTERSNAQIRDNASP